MLGATDVGSPDTINGDEMVFSLRLCIVRVALNEETQLCVARFIGLYGCLKWGAHLSCNRIF